MVVSPSAHCLFDPAEYPLKLERERAAAGLATVTKERIEEFSAPSASSIRAVCL
jgi:hypothetical protein